LANSNLQCRRQLWGTATRAPSTSNNLFLSLNLQLHKAWQRLCAVAPPNILVFCDSSYHCHLQSFSRGNIGDAAGNKFWMSVPLSCEKSIMNVAVFNRKWVHCKSTAVEVNALF